MIFKNDLSFFADELLKSAGESVSITRAGVNLGTFEAVPSAPKIVDLGRDGRHIFGEIFDFSFNKSANYTPQKGDVIAFNGAKYEVRPYKNNEGNDFNLYSLDDPNGAVITTRAQRIV